MKQNRNSKAVQPARKFFHRPVPCAFLAVMGWFVCSIFYMIVTGFFPDNCPQWVLSALEIPVITLYVLWLKKKLGNGFTLGFRFDNLWKSLLLCAAVCVVIAYYAPRSIQAFLLIPMELSGGEFFTALLNQLFYGINPGVTEEYMFRVLLMGIIMHFSVGKKHRLAWAVGVSSCTFGVLHLLNLTNGAPLADTIYQVFYACACGLLFAAVYARTHNILAPMIAHSLWDIVEKFYVPFYPNLSELPQEIQLIIPEEAMNIVITILLSVVGLYLLRPSKHHEIEAHWGSLIAAEDVAEGSAV